jgi:hypothetical protein
LKFEISDFRSGGHVPVLSERQVEFLHEEGYLVVDDLFVQPDLAPVIDKITVRLRREYVGRAKSDRWNALNSLNTATA